MKIFYDVDNNRGVVLMTVVIVIAVMMVLTVSIISLNVSQGVIVAEEVKKNKCEILIEGYANKFTADLLNHLIPDSYHKSYVITLDGVVYNIAADREVALPCSSETCPVDFNCTTN